MPKGAPRLRSDTYARQGIATDSVLRLHDATLDDRELRSLRDAERVLFHDVPYGLVPGSTWDVSHPVEGLEPDADTSGLPAFGVVGPRSEDSVAQEAWMRTLVKPDIDVRFEHRVIKYLQFYRDSTRGQAIAKAWARKSGRFAPSIRAMLAKAGLPQDLVWLSLVESGHNSEIQSPAGAAGLWQFIPSTAEMYGLTVDRWVDERLDPRRSTEAAILLLSDLEQRFGNWSLAMAAYNMGYGGLSRAISKYNTNDFFALTRFEAGVPWETSLYVPKIMATALMMNNKAVFGLAEIAPDPAERFDTIYVESGTPLQAVADAAEISIDELKPLNAQYIAERLPPSTEKDDRKTWRVALPVGRGTRALQKLSKRQKSADELSAVVVRLGDTVQSIAANSGCNEERIRSLNKIGLREELRPGTVLLAPEASASAALEKEVVVVPPKVVGVADRRRVFYRVAAGDSLAEIASALGVGVDELVVHNSIDTSARLQPGMVLQAYVAPEASLEGVRYFVDTDSRVLVAGTVPFHEYFEEQNGRQRFVVRVRKGDTFSALAKRYGLSVGSLERINQRSRHDMLKEGEELVIYGPKGSAPAGVSAVEASALGPVIEPKSEALPTVTRKAEQR